MRIGLIAALRHSEDGLLRAGLPLAGRSVIAWQAALLRGLGVERVLCLAETPGGTVLDLQHRLEGEGVQFHALRGPAAIPALVRAEDDLVIIADGLVPDPAVVRALAGGEGGGRRNFMALVLCLMMGTAAMPHILTRYYTTPTVAAARTAEAAQSALPWSALLPILHRVARD